MVLCSFAHTLECSFEGLEDVQLQPQNAKLLCTPLELEVEVELELPPPGFKKNIHAKLTLAITSRLGPRVGTGSGTGTGTPPPPDKRKSSTLN